MAEAPGGSLIEIMHAPTRSWLRSAFTLIELLVVTAVLSILATLILSGMVRAKGKAQCVACMSKLKQWGQATYMYAGDHEDNLPRESAVDGINTWDVVGAPDNQDVWYNGLADSAGVPTMAHYAQTPSSQQEFYEQPSIFRCPGARFAAVAATYPNFSLAMNSKLMLDYEGEASLPIRGSTTFAPFKIDLIRVPEKTALFLDCGVPGEEQISTFQAPYSGQPKAYASQFSARHNRTGNILFVAGHVLTLPGDKVVDLNPDSVNRGGAIFPPTEVIWRHEPTLVP